jgi:hypothetical protein
MSKLSLTWDTTNKNVKSSAIWATCTASDHIQYPCGHLHALIERNSTLRKVDADAVTTFALCRMTKVAREKSADCTSEARTLKLEHQVLQVVSIHGHGQLGNIFPNVPNRRGHTEPCQHAWPQQARKQITSKHCIANPLLKKPLDIWRRGPENLTPRLTLNVVLVHAGARYPHKHSKLTLPTCKLQHCSVRRLAFVIASVKHAALQTCICTSC